MELLHIAGLLAVAALVYIFILNKNTPCMYRENYTNEDLEVLRSKSSRANKLVVDMDKLRPELIKTYQSNDAVLQTKLGYFDQFKAEAIQAKTDAASELQLALSQPIDVDGIPTLNMKQLDEVRTRIQTQLLASFPEFFSAQSAAANRGPGITQSTQAEQPVYTTQELEQELEQQEQRRLENEYVSGAISAALATIYPIDTTMNVIPGPSKTVTFRTTTFIPNYRSFITSILRNIAPQSLTVSLNMITLQNFDIYMYVLQAFPIQPEAPVTDDNTRKSQYYTFRRAFMKLQFHLARLIYVRSLYKKYSANSSGYSTYLYYFDLLSRNTAELTTAYQNAAMILSPYLVVTA